MLLTLQVLLVNYFKYVMLCAIWYHLYNLKNVKNTHRGVLLLVMLETEACNFTKSNTSVTRMFFVFSKLYKWYQIVQHITNVSISPFAEAYFEF